MSHWAELDDKNYVTRVLFIDNDEYDDDQAQNFLLNAFGGRWLKTSYNTVANKHLLGGIPFRYNYAGTGYYYDQQLDAFIPPKPYDSWVLNQETCNWETPTPYPEDGENYVWDEGLSDWKNIGPIIQDEEDPRLD